MVHERETSWGAEVNGSFTGFLGIISREVSMEWQFGQAGMR